MDGTSPLNDALPATSTFEHAQDRLWQSSSVTERLWALGRLSRDFGSESRTHQLLRAVALSHTDGWIRVFALRELLSLTPADNELIEICWKMATTGDDRIARFHAWACLTSISADRAPSKERFVEIALQDQDVFNRQRALATIAEKWKGQEDTLEVLRQAAANDTDLHVRLAAIVKLADDGFEPQSVIELAKRVLLSAPDAVSRAVLVDDFAVASSSPPLWDVLHWVLREESDTYVRESALEAIINNWPNTAQTAELLGELAIRENDRMAEIALTGLIEHFRNSPQTYAVLLRIAVDGDNYSLAIDELASTWVHEDRTWQLFRDILFSTGWKHQALDVLYAFCKGWPGDPATCEVLNKAVFRTDLSHVPEAAMRCLAESWSVDVPAFLQATIETSDNAWHRSLARRFLDERAKSCP